MLYNHNNQTIDVKVNGVSRHETIDSRLLLCDFLRGTLGLTGTHVGCEHGICGACTVLYEGQATRSCLMFAVQCNHKSIDTIEGLDKDGLITALQDAFKRNHALQCGFCTAGMLIIAHDFLAMYPSPTLDDIKEAMSANICRCTGYLGIIQSVHEVSIEMSQNKFAGSKQRHE
jgi:aerobic-type carbon monoxide dehydrogenase small subunit (CoxS/CutS family)